MSLIKLAPKNGDQNLAKGWLTVEGFEPDVLQFEDGLAGARNLDSEDDFVSAMSHNQLPASSTATTLGENNLPPAQRLSLSDFSITRSIGKGTYGNVLLVKHNSTGRCGALKITRKYPEAARNRCRMTRAERLQTATRFFITMQEQRALRRVTGAPGMLDMLASFHDSSNFYVFSEYYPGGDLERRLIELGRFSVDDTRFYAAELILGLQTLRNMGIIHRDIKPANVLIDADGHLALADFGLARTFDEYDGFADWGSDPLPPSPSEDPFLLKRRTDMRCGSAEYMAPEIIVGEDYSHPADMWSVGVITFQMLVGRLPWDRDDYDDKTDFDNGVLQLSAFATEEEVTAFALDGIAINLIDCMLEKHQENRPMPSDMPEHPFFESIDWKMLSQRQIPAPWIPSAEDDEAPSGEAMIIIEGTPVESAEDPLPAFTFMSSKMELLAHLSTALVGLETPGRPSSMCSTLCEPDSPLSLADEKTVLAKAILDSFDVDCYGSACKSVTDPTVLVFDLCMPDLAIIPCPSSVSTVVPVDSTTISQTSQVHTLNPADIPCASSVSSIISDVVIDPASIPCPLSAASVISEHLMPGLPVGEPSFTFASPDQDLELGLGGHCDFEQPAKLSIFGRLKSWAVGMFNGVKNAWSLWGSTSLTF